METTKSSNTDIGSPNNPLDTEEDNLLNWTLPTTTEMKVKN